MDKTNKICLIISSICIIIVISFCAFLIIRHGKEKNITDALKFKQEYEYYNLAQIGDEKLIELDIPEDNVVEYKSAKEIVEVLKNEDAVIYFGYATCPLSRNIISPLLKAAKDENIEKIYYLDIKDIRDEYEFSGTITPKKTKEGMKAYYEILDFFGGRLEDYYVKDQYKNEYGTGVKRLLSPTIVTVKKGKLIDMHEKTVLSHKNPYEKLSEEEEQEIYAIYLKMFNQFKEESN